MSMVIDPIYRARSRLAFDQTLELCLIGSFYNNGFIFDAVMSNLLGHNFAADNESHPWFVYKTESQSLMPPDTWQGGVQPRYQSSSNSKFLAFTEGYKHQNLRGEEVETNKGTVD